METLFNQRLIALANHLQAIKPCKTHKIAQPIVIVASFNGHVQKNIIMFPVWLTEQISFSALNKPENIDRGNLAELIIDYLGLDELELITYFNRVTSPSQMAENLFLLAASRSTSN